jgi:endonuclease/exonuclease/phosphatase (EEP) superfamily protein YafD
LLKPLHGLDSVLDAWSRNRSGIEQCCMPHNFMHVILVSRTNQCHLRKKGLWLCLEWREWLLVSIETHA